MESSSLLEIIGTHWVLVRKFNEQEECQATINVELNNRMQNMSW